MNPGETLDAHFRVAVSAIDAGDVTELERLLAAYPASVRARLGSPADDEQGQRFAEIAAYLCEKEG